MPDEVVMTIVLERIATLKEPVGFVLDGFPRTIAQATEAYAWGDALGLTFQAVIALHVLERVLLERVVRRGERSGRVDDTPDTSAAACRSMQPPASLSSTSTVAGASF